MWRRNKFRREALAALGPSLEPLFRELTPLVRELGFDSWRFVVLDQQPADRLLFVKTTLPEHFTDRYLEHQFWHQDPRHRHGLASVRPLMWSPALFENAPGLWQIMHDIDVTQGMSQACHHSSGMTALLCLSRSQPLLNSVEFDGKLDRVVSLANRLTVASIERIAKDELLESSDSESGKLLSPRERTILLKTAEGLTAANIAADLFLSERTVQFHISSAMVKLDVSNKTAAVAKAIASGLIQIDVDAPPSLQ